MNGKAWSPADSKFVGDSIAAKTPLNAVVAELKKRGTVRTAVGVYQHALQKKMNPSTAWKYPHEERKDNQKRDEAPVEEKEKDRMHIGSLSRSDCRKLLKLFKIGGDAFFIGMREMFPHLSYASIANYLSHPTAYIKRINERIAKLDKIAISRKTAASAPKKDPVQIIKAGLVKSAPKGKIFSGGIAHSTPDEVSLLTEILNEERVQTSILTDLAGKLGK